MRRSLLERRGHRLRAFSQYEVAENAPGSRYTEKIVSISGKTVTFLKWSVFIYDIT